MHYKAAIHYKTVGEVFKSCTGANVTKKTKVKGEWFSELICMPKYNNKEKVHDFYLTQGMQS